MLVIREGFAYWFSYSERKRFSFSMDFFRLQAWVFPLPATNMITKRLYFFNYYSTSQLLINVLYVRHETLINIKQSSQRNQDALYNVSCPKNGRFWEPVKRPPTGGAPSVPKTCFLARYAPLLTVRQTVLLLTRKIFAISVRDRPVCFNSQTCFLCRDVRVGDLPSRFPA